MSTNCIRCVKNKRTGHDLLCDECRASDSRPSSGSADSLYGNCVVCGKYLGEADYNCQAVVSAIGPEGTVVCCVGHLFYGPRERSPGYEDAIQKIAKAKADQVQALQAKCSHKFIDSNHCLKCGWVPPNAFEMSSTPPTVFDCKLDSTGVSDPSNGYAPVAVLFARSDSIYKTLPGCDVWDIERDALRWPGGCPVVAHPPCRAWGRLRHFARPGNGEHELALWAVKQVQRWGGVLEHPVASLLWPAAGLPKPGEHDQLGGWTMGVSQWWWGHRADKPTLLYVCGVEPRNVPALPFKIGEASHVIQSRKRSGYRPHVSKPEREHTPVAFARWLLELARRTQGHNDPSSATAGPLTHK